MNAKEKYQYWLDAATYDIISAEAMFKTGRWLYVVFTCQQALEKLTKGLYIIYVDDNVPRVHNISFILGKFESRLTCVVDDDLYRFLDSLTAFYIEGRYPSYKENISYNLDEEKAKKTLQRAKEVFEWLQTLVI